MARKILLADDSVTAQNMGRKILADAGYEVITVNNGSAALKRISETKPDLIVLDVYMPGYSGLEVCQRLKESGETSRIPVVLTVGKLEPFKPEEAKRVRADGFIVKPFEASELLSALSKLEDRIVPRSEATKPGRFARANAALDAAYDKSVAMQEDSGWKNRISFPGKKKSAEQHDPATDNPVHKDLPANVEQKHSPQAQEAAEARVDLGALAPDGLPKDVTPEEIAALAAAAAQVKGKISDSGIQSGKKIGESEKTDQLEPLARPSEILAGSNAVEAEATEARREAAASGEPIDATEKKTDAPVPEAPAMAASAELKPVVSISSGNPANGIAREAEEPVTMAVAAGAEYSTVTSRWQAVPVSLLAEEAALSLEEEMRKALAAVAAEEMAEPAVTSPTPEALPVPVLEAASPVATISAEPASAAFSETAAMTTGDVAPNAADAISEAVKDLEAVAASYTDLHRPIPDVPTDRSVGTGPGVVEPEKLEPERTETAAASAAEPVSAKLESDASPANEVVEAEGKTDETKIEETKAGEATVIENSTAETPKSEPAQAAEVKSEAPQLDAAKPEENAPQPAAAAASSVGESSDAIANTEPEIAKTESEGPAKPAVSHKAANGRGGGTAPRESEMAEHTAAAWASWRRIRETGDSKSDVKSKTEGAAREDDKAAMAVAAGAEKSPEEAGSGEDAEVSSIVDSVLAEMRPRIVEEISRKLGKKK